MFCMLKRKKHILHSFNDSKWRMMALSCSKKLSVLLRGIMSKCNSDFYCLNWSLHSFATENQREPHQKYFKIKIFVTL